jgi:hypothetical protein
MSYIKGEWYGWFITHKQADTHSYLLSWSHYAWTVYGSHHDFDTHDAIMMLIPMTPSWFWYTWRHHDFDTHDAIMILIPMTPSWFWYPWRHHDFDTHDAIMILIPMTPSWFWYPWRHHDFDTHDAIMILTPMTPSWFWYPWPWTCSVCCSHNPVLLHSRIITEFWTIEIRRVTYKQIIYPSEVPEFTPGFLVEITLPNL